jgi:MATE family multidrug resistance protein
MLAMMSSNLMYLIDRFMLAGYSIDAMNASTISGNFACMFSLMFTGVANSAEVFVGQYNGSQQYDKLASPVWQMIYVSLAFMLISVPIAYFSDYLNALPSHCQKDGVEYQKVLMYFAVLPPIRVSLSAFFIGQGKTKIITYSVVVGCILNVILDYSVIYGVEGIVPRLGCKGAAIATVIAEFFQILVLACIFFNSKNRKKHNTLRNFQLDKKLLLDCAKIGIPISFGNFMTILAFYLIQVLMGYSSKDTVTIYNISISLYVFFIFVGDGINRAATAIASNMIGREDFVSIEKTRKLFLTISIFFGLVIAMPLAIFPQWIMSLLDLMPDNISDLYSEIRIVLCLTTITITLETILLSCWGILIAGGDTKYAMTVYLMSLWICVVLPTTILYLLGSLNSAPVVGLFMVVDLIITQTFIYRRYKSMKWYNKLV